MEPATHTYRLSRWDGPLSEGQNQFTQLPDGLITKILTYQPVKPLLQFKCVSKPWCSLIESPQFVKMHLRESIQCKINLGIVLRRWNLVRYYAADFDSLHDVTAIEIEEPLQALINDKWIVGNCNGLFCMLDRNNEMLLWNPSTRKHQELPAAPIDVARLFSNCFTHGFLSINQKGYMWLTVKPVLRFKCVSKSWCSFIEI